MNERIRELAEEAYFDCDISTNIKIPKEFVEKFAELIFRECINVISESREVRQTAYYYRNRLAEHFGVTHG